jgi:hypothetical protein
MVRTDPTERAAKAAGNWRRFESFGWDHSRDEDADQWTVVYTHNRDSGLLDQSNAAAIEREMEPFIEDGTARSESHGHWACGWVDGYAIRVYLADGSISPAFERWCEIQDRLEDYPLLDDEDHSRRELEACLEAIEQRGKFTSDDAPEDWAPEVFRILPDRETENRDGTGAYPSDESIQDALRELGWLDREYDDEIPDTVVRCPVCCELIDADELEGAVVAVPSHNSNLAPCPGSDSRAPREANK